MPDFCHLHLHHEYSLLDGLGTAEQYVARAKEIGFTHLGVSDHGNIDGAIKFQGACKDGGIKPIIGCELYVVPDIAVKGKEETRRHIVAMIENEKGWKNMLQMLTIANIDGHFYRPRVSPKIIKDHCEGLVFSSACTATVLREQWGRDLCSYLHHNSSGMYLEIQPINFKEQEELNKQMIEIHQSLGWPLLAANDCHYVNKADHKTHEVLLAMQSKKKWKDPDRWKFDADDLYLKTPDEMMEGFKRQGIKWSVFGSAMANTMVVAEKCCNFRIPKAEVFLPKVPGYEGRDDNELLQEICHDAFYTMIKGNPAKRDKIKLYRERMQEELNTISTLGFSRYFLIVWELVNWSRNNNIFVGPGRGSVSGSLVAYLLRITLVDPLEHGLVFARFISPARIDLPDIDLDFEDRKRHMVREHLENVYGKECVAGVSTYATLKGKGAVRDVSRVFDIPIVDVDKAAKCIVTRGQGDQRTDLSIADAFITFEDGIAFKAKYPDVCDIAMSLEGLVKGTGQHAAAMIVSDEDLTNCSKTYLRQGKEGEKPIINWDKNDAEYSGLMKMDILGLNALTVLSEAKDAIKRNHGVDLRYEDIDLEDKKVLAEFSKGNSIGCFQFASGGLRRYLTQLGIESFSELSAANALWRPGTLRTGMVSEYVMRKHGQQEWGGLHPLVDKITKDTYGVLLYQEQVMFFMYDLAGLGWKTADNIRKVISKKMGAEQFNEYRDLFVDGCLAKGTLDREQATAIWENASAFGHYGFNKSHSVAYAMLGFWDMYLKVYYPAEFIACSLTFSQEEKKLDLTEEAKRLGLTIRLPKIGISKGKEWVVKGKEIYAPFVEIAGIGDKAAEMLDAYQNGFLNKTPGKKIADLLHSVWADVPDFEPTDAEKEGIKHLFKNFNIMSDPFYALHGVIDKLQGQLDVCGIKDIDFDVPSKDNKWYIGTLRDMKFGYREKLLKSKGNVEMSGMADSLGGVYGMFKDHEDTFCMLVYNQSLYQSRKYEVEHSEDKIMLVKCSHPHKQSNLICNDMCFASDLLEGNVSNLNLQLVKRKRLPPETMMHANGCEECELRKECTAPVMPSRGLYNIMIVGEAPGRDEDKEGRGFCGKSGGIVWEYVKNAGMSREDFYVDNTVKCWPSATKTPSRKHIKACSKWLDREIAAVNPTLILAFGNTSLSFFKDQDKGIMEANGTTEWNDKYNCWICWCIHPAAVLYHRDNKVLMDKGMENFFSKIKEFGGLS
jgi:DNA polymerase III subunit alpha